VRYVDPEADALEQKNDSFLAKLMFWRSAPDPKAEQYRVFVRIAMTRAEVQVLNNGRQSGFLRYAARKILSLLQQQLK